ncbi:hypothetical protein Bhyg_08002, partial [Pseudolycoriella hygida]
VNGTMKPSEVQKSHFIFHGFTPTVFRKHWNLTKLMFATNIPGSTNNSTGEEIVEVDGTGASSSKIAKLSESDEPPPIGFSFTRAPIIATVYKDPDSKRD